MPAGYSGTPLAKKLGYKPALEVCVLDAPAGLRKMLEQLPEDVIRTVALPLGFVDIKVCAVDETWSGLRLSVRKELRGK